MYLIMIISLKRKVSVPRRATISSQQKQSVFDCQEARLEARFARSLKHNLISRKNVEFL